MTVYIVGAEVYVYSYANCVDRWNEVPHLLGIFTNKEEAEKLAAEFDGVVQEVETDILLNDHTELSCPTICPVKNPPPYCEENCPHLITILNDSGISVI